MTSYKKLELCSTSITLSKEDTFQMASKKTSARSVELSSEPFFDKHCAICSKSGKHVEAEKTCLDCRQTLCSRCLTDHDKFDAMRGHRIIDKATSIRGHTALPTQMCDDHSSKLVDMFCLQHDRVCCSACIAIHHRLCEDVDFIPTISAGTKASPELSAVLKDNKATLAELHQRKKEREKDKKRIVDEKNTADKNTQESARRIIQLVNDLKQKSLQNIKKKFNEFNQKIDDDCKTINDAIAALEDDIKELQSPTSDNESQLFVTVKQSKRHKELGVDVNTKMGISLTREALHFNIDRDIEANIRKLSSLGELETPFFSAKVLGHYQMRLKNDKNKCTIFEICPMPDETILVSDTENQKLKRLDKSYNHIGYCKLPGKPHSICRTGPTEVAITLTAQRMVQFVSITQTLTPSRSFHVGENCRGIAYSHGQFFITCGGSNIHKEGPGEVRVYSTDGKLLHNLPQQSTGQQVWSCPMRIALTQNGIIVTDYEHGVVTMDRDGSNMNKNPLGVGNLCVQDQSLWFLGSNKTNNIYQVNNDGSSLGTLLTTEDAHGPVCYQRDGDRLIVGFYDCDYIEVFLLNRK